MELSSQIRKHRTAQNLSQEQLADMLYVSRQTISNWENQKSYPDIHSLLMMSTLFDVSVDQLIKGDLNVMKEIISEKEIQQFNRTSRIFSVHLLCTVILAVPLVVTLKVYGYVILAILFVITMYWAIRVEKIKKFHDVQTYKEIVAFSEGKKLDEINRLAEAGKRPYQNILKVVISAVVTAVICVVMTSLFQMFRS